jgi:HD-GYP domain-containing protein (c-di-GMP phosphodiesterase class II)
MTMQRELLLSKMQDHKAKRHELFLTAVEKLAQSVALRDTYTGEHSRRATRFALLLGEQLGLSAEDLDMLRYFTPLHDIGKIGIADGILRTPDPLTPEEFANMQSHTILGAKIIQLVPEFRPGLAIVRSHHERWDGHGYPDGLAGQDIPLLARIVAVAESFDVMVFDTPYRKGISIDEAFAELETQQGRQFDPTVVAAFLQARKLVVEQVELFITS